MRCRSVLSILLLSATACGDKSSTTSPGGARGGPGSVHVINLTTRSIDQFTVNTGGTGSIGVWSPGPTQFHPVPRASLPWPGYFGSGTNYVEINWQDGSDAIAVTHIDDASAPQGADLILIVYRNSVVLSSAAGDVLGQSLISPR